MLLLMLPVIETTVVLGGNNFVAELFIPFSVVRQGKHAFFSDIDFIRFGNICKIRICFIKYKQSRYFIAGG